LQDTLGGVDRLSKDDILKAFDLLNKNLEGQSCSAEIVVMGGAAMVLLFGVRDSTKDVDCMVLSPTDQTVPNTARAVAAELKLPEDWLNDAAKGYLHGLSLGDSLFESSGLRVRSVSLYQLLAMKLSAWRDDVDISDSSVLLQNLTGGRDKIWAAVNPHLVPGRELKARYAFDDLWESLHGTS